MFWLVDVPGTLFTVVAGFWFSFVVCYVVAGFWWLVVFGVVCGWGVVLVLCLPMV